MSVLLMAKMVITETAIGIKEHKDKVCSNKDIIISAIIMIAI